jgi:RNA polymerase sigma-70 factor (ECF subfamily)
MPPAFEDLFRREYQRVVAIAHRVVADGDEAEDVAQDVFVSFYRRHPAEAQYAAPWLYAAAAHTALNVLRSRERRGKRDVVEAIRRDAQAPDPAASAEAAETRSEVRTALARLPERSAALLVLRYSGLSYEEIAAALGLRQTSIGTLLRRAEDAFRREVTK